MKTNRRQFISSAHDGIGAALPIPSWAGPNFKNKSSYYSNPNYDTLDEILKQPVLKRELFPSPVIIETVELLRDRNNFICRVRSKDGAEGISIGSPNQGEYSYPMFVSRVQPFFKGKDARDLDLLVARCEHSVKMQGIPLCVQIATMEFAVLDMLGNIANKPVGKLIGEIHNPRIVVYQGSRYNELRRLPPEESLELVKQDLVESKAKAIKIRAGAHQNFKFNNAYYPPGRTEKLISMTRKEFGDNMVLMIDANGSYDTKEGIRIGKILEEHNFLFYEEPVPWNYREETKQVTDALQIPIAVGEEEFDLHVFRWLIANNAVDIVQPDQFYFGGMIRSMQVARMAAAFGKTIVPHMTDGGLGYLYMLHFVSACPNAGPYHEFKLFATKDANGNEVPIESKTEPFTSDDGAVKVPTGSGLGVVIDLDYIKTHKVLKV